MRPGSRNEVPGRAVYQSPASRLGGLVAILALGHFPATHGADLSGKVAPTYVRDVEPILNKGCVRCHRKEQVGPFPLETYQHARKRAFDIAAVAADRSMPPWKPVAGAGPRLQHDRSLSVEDIGVLRNWAESGAPRGIGPEARRGLPDGGGWKLGQPDLVLEMTEAFQVPASGPDLYRCFVIPTGLLRDTYISGMEFRAGNRRVVHHMMAFLEHHGAGRQRDAAEAGPGYASYAGAGVDIQGDLGGWAAGNEPVRLPDGIGRVISAGADVILQVHYHPSGKPELDRTRIGLYFARTPIKRTLHWANATNAGLRIPPNDPRVQIKASWYVPADLEALAVTPHMHQLGREFHMTVTYPGGRTQDLLHIVDWDPAWQDSYYFEKPVSLPHGSVVRVVAHYDNSSHARNPHKPPKLVTWGPGVSDEMCVGYIGVVKKGQDLTRPGEKDDLFEILTKQFFRKMIREQLDRGH